ncbi:MAG: ankyrin repeat domain-containing protein [Puniceicoccales bacterium]|jgi:ankyrin repeat protein|nr:ankyrin repeat domain-containing protein [Puniceicoccales bacterium]
MDGKKLFRNITMVGCLLGGFTNTGAYGSTYDKYEDITDKFSFLIERLSTKKAKSICGGLEANAAMLQSTLLNYAASYGRLKIVRFLLENHADPNAKRSRDFTPLNGAVEEGYYEIVELLLKYGADPNQASGKWISLGQAVSICVGAKKKVGLKLLKLLLDHGADPNQDSLVMPLITAALYAASPKAIHLLVAAGANVDAKGDGGNTALHEAAGKGHFPQVKALIEAGANVDLPNELNQTPLDCAIAGRNEIRRDMRMDRSQDSSIKAMIADTDPLLKRILCSEYNDTIQLLREHYAGPGKELEVPAVEE